MKYVILSVLLVIICGLMPTGCSEHNFDRGDIFTAVEQTLSKPGPVRDDLIARGFVIFSSTDNTTSPVPSEINIGEIEGFVIFGNYIIDEDGYLQFGPLYTPMAASSTPSINTPSPWTPNILEPEAPPEGSYYLPGGIRVIPSVESPWPEVPVCIEPYTLTHVKTGDEFSIGLDVSVYLGMTWTADFDESVLSLVAEETVTFDPDHRLGTQWFRFKAIGEANTATEINLDLIALRSDNDIVMRLVFGFNVIE